jgi:hypothetical protein
MCLLPVCHSLMRTFAPIPTMKVDVTREKLMEELESHSHWWTGRKVRMLMMEGEVALTK